MYLDEFETSLKQKLRRAELKGRAGSSIWGLSSKQRRDRANRICHSQGKWSYKNECLRATVNPVEIIYNVALAELKEQRILNVFYLKIVWFRMLCLWNYIPCASIHLFFLHQFLVSTLFAVYSVWLISSAYLVLLNSASLNDQFYGY